MGLHCRCCDVPHTAGAGPTTLAHHRGAPDGGCGCPGQGYKQCRANPEPHIEGKKGWLEAAC